MNRAACVADLDGTLITANSMKRFMPWLLRHLARRGRVGALSGASWWMALRWARLVSHRRMKWHLARIGRRCLSKDDWRRFAASLLPLVNHDAAEVISGYAGRGAAVLVASAAMLDYVEPLVALLGYDGAVATACADDYGDYTEARGAEKARLVDEWLAARGLSLECFMTDHPDDLPMVAAYPGRSLLVNPAPASLARFRGAGFPDLPVL